MRQRRISGTGQIEHFKRESGDRYRARYRHAGQTKLGPTRDNILDAMDDLLLLRYPQPPPPPKPEVQEMKMPPRAVWRGGKKNECKH